MKYVLITGVSTGIGFDATKHLIDKGFFVFGSVRKQQDADRLSALFGSNFMPLVFDVTDHEAIDRSLLIVKKTLGNNPLWGLVNNAGIAVAGPLKYITSEELNHQLDVNVLGVLRTTNAFAPLLGATNNFRHPPGRIINMSSVSGLFASPFTGPYSISKYALESMNDVYRREFLPFGVDVIAIEPGPIKTPIWGKTTVKDLKDRFPDTDYNEMLPKISKVLEATEKKALPVEEISKLIYKIFTTKRPKPRYIIHRGKLGLYLVRRLLPTRLVDRLIKKSIFEKSGSRPF